MGLLEYYTIEFIALAVIGGFLFVAYQRHRAKMAGVFRFFELQAPQIGGVASEGPLGLVPVIKIERGPFEINITCFPAGKSSPATTNATLKSTFPTRTRLTVIEEGSITRFVKSLGLKDLELGNPQFDHVFLVQTNDERLARQTLIPAFQEGFLEYRALFGIAPELQLFGSRTVVRVNRIITSPEEFGAFLGFAATLLGSLHQQMPKPSE